MTRLLSPPAAEAGEKATTLFAGIKSAIGMLPNAYLTIGMNSPDALAALLQIDALQRGGSLSVREVETVKLAVSQESLCAYCLGAHTLLAKKAGLDKEEILALRHGYPSGNAKLDALARFVRELARTRGQLPDSSIQAVRSAGFSDPQIVDTVLAITSITFTNLFNRINSTEMDFPRAD